jgi:2-succinyl-5-enolpyruvyl-6-hydroxy-3-cyclohexene-1-carboxylate synthase
VVAGDGSGPEARMVAEAGHWPLLAEPSSGARCGLALTSPRLVLEHSALSADIERVISFGHATLSRSVVSLLANAAETIHVGTQATFPVRAGDNVSLVDAVEVGGPDELGWLGRWQEADAAVTEAIAAIDDDRLAAARAVWDAVSPHETLWLGSSNPIRDVDLVAAPFPPGGRRKVLANRGLAGIDGTVSSAIGAALVRGRTVAYVGDLTFLHGSNGMLIGPGEPRPDLTIVVANDDGGGIFAGLEQGAAEFADSFERVFATPTGADLAHLCAAYGIGHSTCAASELSAALQAARPSGVNVVEVPVERRDRREFAAAVADAARCALRPR